jgi:uncharacterized protein YbgA (DUF1722 family)/uncharacterized protein YbbK (DUF523 family)
MPKFPKPVVVLSKCLEFEACRYNGQMIPDSFVKKIEPYVNFKLVCPEIEIGLGVPRDPIRVMSRGAETKLIQPATGRDISSRMLSFANSYLKSLKGVDGFILKSRSPSCGIKDVKLFANPEDGMAIGKTKGFFAGKVLEHFPGLAIEDEGRLKNFKIRDHFLTKLYLSANFRNVKKAKSINGLISFHSRNKFLMMAYNQKEMGILGKIVANQKKVGHKEAIGQYEEHLVNAFMNPPRKTSYINVLMHSLGFFSDRLTAKEKAYFLDLLEDFRNEKIPVSAILVVLKAWIIKYEQKYLEQQTIFEPYPKELIEISDSGKGRDL